MTEQEKIEKLARWMNFPTDRVVYDEDLGDEDDDYAVWWVAEGARRRPWRPDNEIQDAWMLLSRAQGITALGAKESIMSNMGFVILDMVGVHNIHELPAIEAARAICDKVLEVIK